MEYNNTETTENDEENLLCQIRPFKVLIANRRNKVFHVTFV